MPYELIEEGVTSDVTFRARGETLDELFAAAADATLSVMVTTPESVLPRATVDIDLEAAQLDLLLLRLLEELIYQKDVAGLLLRATSVHVEAGEDSYRVHARLQGEKLDFHRHELIADVKAVTLYGLRVERVDSAWEAEVTLDI